VRPLSLVGECSEANFSRPLFCPDPNVSDEAKERAQGILDDPSQLDQEEYHDRDSGGEGGNLGNVIGGHKEAIKSHFSLPSMATY
jgi:hypothetical protein